MNLQKKAMYIIAGVLFLVIGINSIVLTYLASNKYKKVILAKTTSMGDGLQQKLNEITSAGIPVSGMVGVRKDLQQQCRIADVPQFHTVRGILLSYHKSKLLRITGRSACRPIL